MVELPTALTPEWELLLRQMGVTQAKSIEVWPAGLAAVAWDGEGHGEWLASEAPTLAVRCDHAIDQVYVSMGVGGASLAVDMSTTPPGQPVFIELPALPVGTHQFSVVARRGATEVVGDLNVVMRVREARLWSPGVTPHGPLTVEVEPASPSLEQLWEGRVDVRVLGPEGRPLQCRVAMFRRLNEAPVFEHRLDAVALPFTGEQWRHHLDVVRKLQAAQRAYDGARVCVVEFSADELGSFTIRCEREFVPLRWSLRSEALGFVAHLHCDVDSSASSRVERFPFERPAAPETLPWRLDSEYAAPRAGGSTVATLDDGTASIVVPPLVRGLHDLKLEPRIELDREPREAVLRCLRVARLWAGAHLPGDLFSAQRRRVVLRAIMARVASMFGGSACGPMPRLPSAMEPTPS